MSGKVDIKLELKKKFLSTKSGSRSMELINYPWIFFRLVDPPATRRMKRTDEVMRSSMDGVNIHG